MNNSQVNEFVHFQILSPSASLFDSFALAPRPLSAEGRITTPCVKSWSQDTMAEPPDTSEARKRE